MTNDSRYSHNARLTELSRRVISAADQLAFSLNHRAGVGHLLLVMVQEKRSPVCQLLRESGLDEAELRERLAHPEALLLADISSILNQMHTLADQSGSHYIGTEHLLLALLADPAGAAALRSCGVLVEVIQRRLKAT